MSGRRTKELRKRGVSKAAIGAGRAKAAYKRHRTSAYTGRLHGARVPPTPGAWAGRRKRRPSWKDARLKQLDEATEFGGDKEISDPVFLIRELKRHPQFVEPLRKKTDPRFFEDEVPSPAPKKAAHRPRGEGDWFLLYLGWVITRDPALRSFWGRWASSPIWHECGFAEQPEYELMRIRFKELQNYWLGFREVSQLVVQQAVRHDPEIAEFWMVDATGFQSHLTLEHCCEDKKACRDLLIKQGKLKPWKKRLAKLGEDDGSVDDSRGDKIAHNADDVDREHDAKGRGLGRKLGRPSHDVIEAERHKEQAEEEDNLDLPPGTALEPLGSDGTFQFFEIEGHRYRTRDLTSGLRRYETTGNKSRSWFGGYGMPAVCPKYGAAVAVEVFAADDQEANHYPDLFDAAVAAIGKTPLAVTTDRGPGHPDFDEFNTRRGVATVRPFRKTSGASEREDLRTDVVDEHGIPRCQHCGGETDMDSPGLGWFLDKKDEPRIRFRCLVPYTDKCKKIQSVSCSEEWRLLLPLNLKQELYHGLRQHHFEFENIFGKWRKRYAALGKDASSRLLSQQAIPAQRLRAQAAVLLDWFRICLRHGFLGSWRTRNTNQPKDITPGGAQRLANVLGKRRRRRLHLPYGAAAEWLKLKRKPPATGAAPPPPAPRLGSQDPLPDGF